MNFITPTTTASLIVTLLVLPATSAWADWTAVSGPETKDYVTYVDFSTMTKTESGGALWTLNDFKNAKTISGKSIISTKTHLEYQCADNKKRLLEFSWHAEKMGGGDPLMIKKETDTWKDFAADSIDDKRRNIACGKLKKTDFP